MISRALLNAPFFIPKDADLLRNRKVNTKKRQNRHLPELAFLILGTYFTAPFPRFFHLFLHMLYFLYYKACGKNVLSHNSKVNVKLNLQYIIFYLLFDMPRKHPERKSPVSLPAPH